MLFSPTQRRDTHMSDQQSSPTPNEEKYYTPEPLTTSQDDLSDNQAATGDDQPGISHHAELAHEEHPVPTAPSPQVPTKVTAAATLGIINGALGIFRAIVPNILFIRFLSVLDGTPFPHYRFNSSGDLISGKEFSALIAWLHGVNYGDKIFTCGIAVIMLIYSTRLIKSKKRTALVIAGAAQSLIMALEIVFFLIVLSYLTIELGSYVDVPFIEMFVMIMVLLVMAILPIVIIVFLRSRDVTTWCRTQH